MRLLELVYSKEILIMINFVSGVVVGVLGMAVAVMFLVGYGMAKEMEHWD